MILKSSTQRRHSISIALPLNSERLPPWETVRGGIGRLSLIPASCLWGLVVPLVDHYIPVLSKRIYPKWTTKTLSPGQSMHQGSQSCFVPWEKGGLSHLGFVWVAKPTSESRVNLTTHTQRHANTSHQVLHLMPLQWMSGKTRLKYREWDCAPGSWHGLNEKENNTVKERLYLLVSLSGQCPQRKCIFAPYLTPKSVY